MATNPPNQNNMVNASSPSIPYLAAADESKWENFMGITRSGTRARIDHAGAKIMKFTSEGDDWRQCDDHHDDTVGGELGRR